MLRKPIGLTGLLFAVGALMTQPAMADTMEDALRGLLGSSPKIAAAKRNLEANQAGTKEAFSAYLPTATLGGETGYEYTDSPSRRTDNQNPLNANRNVANLTVTETLWDGNRRPANSAIADLNLSVAQDTVTLTIQDVLLQAITAYHEVLREQRLIEIAKSDEENVQQQLHLEDERVQRGSGITVDVLQAKSRLQLSKERRVTFEGRLRDAISAYKQIFNVAPDLAGLVEPLPPMSLLPESRDAAEQMATVDNPAIAVSNKSIDIAKQERVVARSEFFPKLDLVGQAGYEHDVDGLSGYRENYSVVVRATWEIFSGFATKARVSKASAVYHQRINEHDDAQRKVLDEVRTAWEDLATARERVDLLQNAVNIAEEVYNARQKLRESGKESSLNVLDSLRELKSAQINFVDASYDARLAVYRVLRAVGHLRPRDMGLQAAAE
jgi:adhesin transport system outer membrane protein